MSRRDALKDLCKFMREMYLWCDQNGLYKTGMVSVSRYTVKQMRRVVDLVLEAEASESDIRVPFGYDTFYAYLQDTSKKKGQAK